MTAAVIAFFLPLATHAWLTDDPPEARLLASGGRLSALIVDGEARVLIVNTGYRADARSLPGQLSWPWETDPQLLIAPAGDDAARGLWEALARLRPAQVLVAGVPGADPLWREVEAECARRGIELRYVAGQATVQLPRLALTVFGPLPGEEGSQSIVIRRDRANVLVALDDRLPPADGQVLVTNGDGKGTSADLIVTARAAPRRVERQEVVVERAEVVRLVIDAERIRVFGGTPRGPATPGTGGGR